MNQIGKFLVFANFVFAMTFLAWAIGVAANRVPLNTTTVDGEKVVGDLDRVKERITGLTEARERADERWADNTKRLHALEREALANRAYYAEQLQMAQTGTDRPGKRLTGVQQLVFNAGVLDMKRTGRPLVKVGDGDARSVAGYDADLRKRLAEIGDVQTEIKDTIAQTKAITERINGLKAEADALTPAEKGLRVLIGDQARVERNAKQEIEYLQTSITNFRVEVQLLKERQAALEKRLKELAPSATMVGGL